jgi:hypothetical protein
MIVEHNIDGRTRKWSRKRVGLAEVNIGASAICVATRMGAWADPWDDNKGMLVVIAATAAAALGQHGPGSLRRELGWSDGAIGDYRQQRVWGKSSAGEHAGLGALSDST